MVCHVVVLAVLATLAHSADAAGAAESTIAVREGWATEFSGAEVTYHVVVNNPGAAGRTVGWRLAAGNRTIHSGEMAATGGDLRLQIPELKEGVVADLRLELALLPVAGNKPIAATIRIIHLFPKNPFADRKRWLEQLRLHVFDPKQRTVEALKALDVPFKAVDRQSMIPAIQAGVLLVGEGVPWNEYRSLVPEMLDAVARGVTVVCLAPADGSMPLPAAGGGAGDTPKEIRLRRADAVLELDKRLDVEQWPHGKRVVARGLGLVCNKGQIALEVTDSADQWPWLEIGLVKSEARFLVCGFGIIDAWDAGPTPRVLLLRLLEYVDKFKKAKESKT